MLLCAGVIHAGAPGVEELHKAAKSGDLKQVETLVAGGVPVNARDSVGGTPLHDSAWAGERDVAEYLIRMGADVNARHAEGGSTPLHYAVMTNRVDVVELLLDRGADVAAVYNSGETALHLAARARLRTHRHAADRQGRKD